MRDAPRPPHLDRPPAVLSAQGLRFDRREPELLAMVGVREAVIGPREHGRGLRLAHITERPEPRSIRCARLRRFDAAV